MFNHPPLSYTQLCHLHWYKESLSPYSSSWEWYRDYTRFFWLSNPTDPNSELVLYRFKTVLFGAVSSPFMLYAALYHHLQYYNTSLSHDIQANLYVDSIVSGCDTKSAVTQYYNQGRVIMSEAKFNLRSWVSSSAQLSSLTHQEHTADSTVPANVLGIHWHTDTHSYSKPLPCILTTR